MDEFKTIMKATFALLGVMLVGIFIADRIMDNPAQAPGDNKT